ncbi:MAG: ABC transporter substrate-binding protein [Hyphomicrobiaceae bacterium]|jgi:putative tryptophan/tyrosine transport system substrate-binding protein
MRRREFIGVLAGTAALPVTARSQQAQKPRRIAFVHSGIPADKLTENAGPFWVRRFYEVLRELGYSEGVNLVVERFSAEGRSDHFAVFAAEVVARNPDLIVSNLNDLVKALMTATRTIPIVAITSDPVANGLISVIARPGGNMTGVSIQAGPGIPSKRLQLLQEALPAATRIAYLTQERQEEYASGASVEVKMLLNVTDASLRRAFGEMTDQKTDAAIVSVAGSYLAHRALIVELAATHRLPMMYPYRDFVELGGLMSYAPDLGELAKRMAIDVHQIFSGANPGDIPYFLPTKFDLVINLKTARSLGLAFPATLFDFATEVIE